MDFRRVYVGAGRKCEGRPVVWETREVCEEARHNCLVSVHLPSLPRTNLNKALGRALPTLYASIGLTPCLRISTMHQDPEPLPDNTPFPYDTNAYPGRRNSSAPFSPALHIPSHKTCGGEHRDMGPRSSRSTLMTVSRSQERPM